MNPQPTNIGLLSTGNHPLLPHLLEGFLQAGVLPAAILLDEKNLSSKQLATLDQRTKGYFQQKKLDEFESLRVPTYSVEDHNSSSTIDLVQELGLDYLVNAGTPRIIKPPLLSAPTHGILNCHPGLLPQFRGCTCVEWAVYLDQPVGNTLHFMTRGIDDGPIVCMQKLTFLKSDGYRDVRVKVYLGWIQLLTQGTQEMVKRGLSPRVLPAQPEGTYYNVIDDHKLKLVVDKLEKGQYKYQF